MGPILLIWRQVYNDAKLSIIFFKSCLREFLKFSVWLECVCNTIKTYIQQIEEENIKNNLV